MPMQCISRSCYLSIIVNYIYHQNMYGIDNRATLKAYICKLGWAWCCAAKRSFQFDFCCSLGDQPMGESMKLALRDALKMVGIVESTTDTGDVPQASWDLYEMIQACLQVGCYFFQFCSVFFNEFGVICILS